MTGAPAPADVVLDVRDLHVEFPGDEGLVRAVRGVGYRLRRGEVLGIVGESGSGKSVTSLAVMGLLPSNARVSGSVRLAHPAGAPAGWTELVGAGERALSRVRGKRIAMIFQDPMTSLNPVYTVGQQIAEAIRAHQDVDARQAAAQAVDLLEQVSIPDPARRASSFPHELSGGMRQRVVIAIAMANKPDVIIADEPTTALDVTVQAQVLEALHVAKAETGAAMVLITHDLGVIAGQADRVLVMYAGRPVEAGTVDEIFYAPRMPYTVGLLGSLPRLDQRVHRLTPISGAPPSMVNMPPGCPFTPRCPLAADRCEEQEPPLAIVDPAADTAAGSTAGTTVDAAAGARFRAGEADAAEAHRAACHFSDRLVGVAPEDLFRPLSREPDPEPAGAALPVGEEP